MRHLLGTLCLIRAIYHLAGVGFGGTPFRPEDGFPMILGGIGGGVGALVITRHNAKRQAVTK